MTVYEKALAKHREWKGKISVNVKVPMESKDDLSLTYTPGVAQPCLEIQKDPSAAYDTTWKGNSVAVVTDGTAVLGLGDIGPLAALPVMEGKAALFKAFAGIDAVPVCLDTKDSDEIVSICKAIAPTYGGINLEDISAPRCVEIERKLKKELSIPVFHDDQHGTAIVVTAALINALKVVGKQKEDITAVVCGTGAAGSSIIHMLLDFGVADIIGYNINGVVNRDDMDSYDFLTRELALITNKHNKKGTLSDVVKGADLLIGVSAPGLFTQDMIRSMNRDPIVFPMANPEPEITYDEAVAAGARIVGTGRSDYPNQVNNVLAFPGLFKGALSVHAPQITEEMKMAAAYGIASLIPEEELSEENIIPSALCKDVAETVAQAVAKAAAK